MTGDLSWDWLQMIWKYSIVPEVEESFEDTGYSELSK